MTPAKRGSDTDLSKASRYSGREPGPALPRVHPDQHLVSTVSRDGCAPLSPSSQGYAQGVSSPTIQRRLAGHPANTVSSKKLSRQLVPTT